MILHRISIALLLLCFFSTFSSCSNHQADFSGDVSINCGSTGASAARNGRQWLGDERPKHSPLLQLGGISAASTAVPKLTSADPVPHTTARISRSQFYYTFQLNPGQKLIRLHFNPSPYRGFKGFKDFFTVEAGPFTLLGNFSASLTADALGVNTFVKEFCLTIEENQQLTVTFSPESSQLIDKYAFINGIEIVSVPATLSYFDGGEIGLRVVGQKSLVYVDDSTALEIVHRLNIKQDPVPVNEDFDGVFPKWATRRADKAKTNTWRMPVEVGFRYLIRLHFSEAGLKLAGAGGSMSKILINEMIAHTSSEIVNGRDQDNIVLYRDYMVVMRGRKQNRRYDILISLQSFDELADGHGVLAGFEIVKLSNPDDSLASPNPLPPLQDSQSHTFQYFLSFLNHPNASGTVAITVISLLCIIVHKLREVWEFSSTEEEQKPSANAERHCRRFPLAEIQLATKNFNEGLLIGRGGFGKVYKGLIDNGQKTVAVKRLRSNSTQGAREFLTEIETLSELRHMNLVSLIGYCRERREMILVYEYMSCGTLADHLYKLGRDSSSLNWKQRLNICIGAARGLDYLHTGHGIIHRDVKASNILLDESFMAKVSDFGLARAEDRSRLQSHVITLVKGTRGYLDSYYIKTGKLTRKSDIFAFGVVLLEVLCGRAALDLGVLEEERLLSSWALDKINKGEVEQIVASSLMEDILPDSLKVFVEVAERCLLDEPKKRPTMAQVVLKLEDALEMQEYRKIVEPNHIALVANDVCPSNEDMMSSANPEQSAEAFTDRHAHISPPIEQTNSNYFPSGEKDGRIPIPYKPLRVLAWDAFWNRLKPFKRKELSLASVICEADIRLPKFDFSKIVAATHRFSSSHKIGEGGSASVYKAVLPTGRIVAVKRFSISGEDLIKYFKNEIVSVSSLHHRNIIKLLGYCIHGQRVMLLYEFMENGTLDKVLFDEHLRHQLQWSVRYKVIIGIAKGVVYLHRESRPATILRDLEPSNILLDNEMNPKISGFDLARNIEDGQSDLTSIIAGNLWGYLPPEYLMLGKISEKTDVYSFGVIVLEMMSGRKNNYAYSEGLMQHAWDLWIAGNVLDLVDESLAGVFSEVEAMRCIQVGLLCTQYDPQQRPTMSCALKMLIGEESSLQEKVVQAQSSYMKSFNSLSLPLDGLIDPLDGLMNPLEGLIDPLEGLIDPLDDPLDGLMNQLDGLIDPLDGLMNPLEGLMDPLDGRPPLRSS